MPGAITESTFINALVPSGDPDVGVALHSLTTSIARLDEAGTKCFQVMDATDRATLDAWIAQWSDLVEFEVVPVLTSQEFWTRRR
jgi:hypothetical protein